MPNKEAIAIDRFYGMPATEADEKPGSAGYCENIDPALSEGRLGGLREDLTTTLTPFTASVLYGEDEAVTYDGVGSFTHIDFSSESETTIGSPPSGCIPVPGMASDGRAVHVGCGPSNIPAWVGKIGGSWRVEEGYLRNYAVEISGTITAGGTSSDDGYFQNGTYFYGISFGYDGGTQESPLAQIKSGGVGPNDLLSYSAEGQADNFGYPFLNVTIDLPSDLPARIDYVYLYRAENPRIDSAPFSDWTLVETFEYTGQIQIDTDDKGRGGLSFEDRTGFSSELDHMRVRYGLSSVIDSVHVVADVDFDGNDLDRSTTLFFSKPYRYDTFDWSADFLDLRTKPLALANWAGRLWVFCSGSTFVVSPATRVEEERLEGIGAIGPQSVVVTDRGMFWADRRNVYWHDGTRIIPIGEGLKRLRYKPQVAWEQLVYTFPVCVTYNAEHDMIVVATFAVTYGFSLRDGDWRVVTGGEGINKLAALMTASGRAILSTFGTGVLALFEGTGRRTCRWESPWLHARGENYTYYKARIAADGTHVLEFYEDGTDAESQWIPAKDRSVLVDTQLPVYSYTVNTNATPLWTKVRGFRIAAQTINPDTTFSFLQLVRRQIGVR